MASIGIFETLKKALSNILEIFHTRIHLLSVDLEISLQRLFGIFWLAIIALCFISLGIVLLSVLLIIIFWDTHRVLVTSILLISYLSLGAILLWIAMRRLKNLPPIFESTLSELKKDRDHLTDRAQDE